MLRKLAEGYAYDALLFLDYVPREVDKADLLEEDLGLDKDDLDSMLVYLYERTGNKEFRTVSRTGVRSVEDFIDLIQYTLV